MFLIGKYEEGESKNMYIFVGLFITCGAFVLALISIYL